MPLYHQAHEVSSGGGSGDGAPFSGIVSGLGVAYTGTNLDFEMAAGTYYIAGTLYSAAQQTISLAAADGSNPRIDVLYADTSGLLGKITGTPAANPSQPQVDPTTQLLLNFILVPAGATSLSGITNVNIYLEDTEWTTTTSGTGFTKNSTNNPFAGSKDIEGTNVTAASYIKLVNGSPISFDGDGNLTFRIFSKATWNANRWLTFQWFLSGVAKGQPVSFTRTSFGFNSAQITSYQYIVIPKSFFAVPTGTNVDELRIVDVGGAIGFYIDNIILQTNGVTIGGGGAGLTQAQADARYALRGAVTASGLTTSTSTLLGRTTASTGAIEEIQAGTGISLAGGLISATGTQTWAAAGVGQTVVGVYDFAVDGAKAAIDFTGLDAYNELLIIARNLTCGTTGVRQLLASVNNGSSYYNTLGDYVTIDSNGVQANATAFGFHSTNSTSARSMIAHIANTKGAAKYAQFTTSLNQILFVASSLDINAVRVSNSGGGNITGGQVYVFAR